MITTRRDTAESLKRSGIDLTRLPKGTVVRVETTDGVLELTTLSQYYLLMRVVGTDPRLKSARIGQFKFANKGSVVLHNWIAKGLEIHITFKNGVYVSPPVISARIEAPSWSLDVF